MPILQRFKLRPLTWVGLFAVAAALLYANWMVAQSTNTGSSLGKWSGWPFHCRFQFEETFSRDPMVVTYHPLALNLNIAVAVILLAGTLFALERTRRDARRWQFSLAALFLMTTILAVILWLDRTPVAWHFSSHAEFWTRFNLRANQWRDIIGRTSTFAPPWFVRTIIHASIIAMLWLAVQITASRAMRIVRWLRHRPEPFPPEIVQQESM